MTNTTKDVFLEKIIKNKIKPPTRYGFSLNKWHKEWEKIKDEASLYEIKKFLLVAILSTAYYLRFVQCVMIFICRLQKRLMKS